MRKIITLILILSIVFASLSFISCGDANKNLNGANDSADSGGESPGDSPEVSVEDTTTGKLLPDIPEADYGGYGFNILVSLNALTNVDVWNDFHAEEENGDVINDAIYRRNAFVEEKYNIKIGDIPMPASDGMERPAAQKNIKNSVAAGDNAYDAVLIGGYGACALASGGFLMDMNAMSPLDLTKQWWDQKANRDLMIKNKMFYTSGDISNVVNEATYAILFNKKLVQDYGLENPYALVKNGE